MRAFTPFLLLSLLALCAFVLAVSLGDQPVSLVTAWRDPGSTDGAIFFSLRLPRATLAALVGASLAVSGCALQALMRNPLADPFVLGVSGGAALGATLALTLGLSVGGMASRLSAPAVFAFSGALAATAGVFFAGRVAGRSSPYTVLLAGAVLNAFSLAAITCLRILTTPEKTADILYWLSGSLGYETFATLWATLGIQLMSVGALWMLAGRLNALSLGDDDAAALGVPVERTRLWVLLFSSLSVSAAVALSGLIGFVGLIVPHVLRLVFGPNQRLLLPLSALGGAALLLLSDLGARLLFPLFHTEPPVGVLTALLGGPLFLWLLHRGRLSGAKSL